MFVKLMNVLIHPRHMLAYRNRCEESLDSLKESINKDGLVNPLTVIKYKRMYYVVSGYRRYKCVKNLKWNKVEVNIIKTVKSDAELHACFKEGTILRFVQLTPRVKLTDTEIGKTLLAARRDGCSMEELATMMNRSISTIYKYMAIANKELADKELGENE